MSMGPENRLDAYVTAWARSLALLLSQLTSESWQNEDAAVTPPNYLPGFSVRISALGVEQWASFRQRDLAALLGAFLGEEVHLGDQLDDMQHEAVEELSRQWCGLAATALKPDFGELSFRVTVEPRTRPEESAAGIQLLRVRQGDRSIEAVLDVREAIPAPHRDNPSQEMPAVSVRPQSPGRVEELMRQGNLELLMGVELGVMLRFGSRDATLREVLDMATGAVLELNREIQEPVELVLNGKIIARGEVVVIDGNYGLRVSEVASPLERAGSL